MKFEANQNRSMPPTRPPFSFSQPSSVSLKEAVRMSFRDRTRGGQAILSTAAECFSPDVSAHSVESSIDDLLEGFSDVFDIHTGSQDRPQGPPDPARGARKQ